MKTRFTYVALGLGLVGLAACDGGGDAIDNQTAVVNSFGPVFAAGFFAEPNVAVLVDPQPGDLTVDPTADPFEI